MVGDGGGTASLDRGSSGGGELSEDLILSVSGRVANREGFTAGQLEAAEFALVSEAGSSTVKLSESGITTAVPKKIENV